MMVKVLGASAALKRAGIYLSAISAFLPSPAFAVSSGGEYTLEYHAIGSGGGSAAAGQYLSRGLAAQPILPAARPTQTAGTYVNRGGFYNPPHFTFQRLLPVNLTLPSGQGSIVLPANAVDKDVFDVNLNRDLVFTPLLVDPYKVDRANSRIIYNEGEWATPLPGNLTETNIFDEQSLFDKPFSSPGYLSLSYQDADGDGILDGSNPPVRAEASAIWSLDTQREMWVKVPSYATDTQARTLTVPLYSPGVYALLGTVDESVKNVYAFPVPFRPNGPKAGIGAGKTGTAAGGITFTNLPQRGNIEIYTLDGILVRKISIPDNLALAQLAWDVRNDSGDKVRSDVYIWRVVSGSNVKTGKLMIIW